MERFAILLTAVAASLCLLATGPSPAAAADPSPEAVESAASAADHLALARSYEEQAARLRERAEYHRKMGERYQRAPLYPKSGVGAVGMEKHCERLADSLEKAAKEADALAGAHRRLAESSGSEK